MDAKTVAPERMPYDSNPSGSTPFSPSSVSFTDSSIDSSVKDRDYKVDNNGAAGRGGDDRGEEEFEMASGRPILRVETPKKAGSFLSPIPKGVSDVDGGGGGGNGDDRGEEECEAGSEKPIKSVEAHKKAGSFLFPMPKSVSDDVGGGDEIVGDEGVGVLKENVLVGQDAEGVKEIGVEGLVNKVAKGGIDSGKEDVSVETGLNKKTVTSIIEDENVKESENIVKGVGGVEEMKIDVTNSEKSDETVESDEAEAVGDGIEQESGFNCKADRDDGDKLIEGEKRKLTNEGDSIVDSFVMESVHFDVAKPGFVVVRDTEGSEVTVIKDKEIPADENSVEIDNKFVQISRDAGGETKPGSDKSLEEGDTVLDSSVIKSIHVDTTKPGVVVFGDVEGIKEAEVTQTGLDAEGADDLTTVYDGDVELVSENIVEAANTEPIEPKADVNKAKDYVDDSSNLGFGDKEEKPIAEVNADARTNADVGEVLSRKKLYEGEGGDRIHFEDTVSKRGFGLGAGEGDGEGSGTDGENEGISSEAAKQFLEELEKASSGLGSHSGTADGSIDISESIDGQIAVDSDKEADSEEAGEVQELFDSAALSALLKAATGGSSDSGSITITSQDGSGLFSVERPAGLGSSLTSVKPAASRTNRPNIFSHPSVLAGNKTENNLSEEERKKLDKLQSIRVKFLRLLHKLGHSAEDSIAAQILYRLALLAGRQTGRIFNLESAKLTAMELEAEGKDELDFSLTILVLGKAGVGKSATINSILGYQKALIDAFDLATTSVREITEVVGGVKIRVFDTPGLKSSAMEQSANRKLLSSVKKVTNKCSPDIVLYVDRLDSQTRDLNDLPLLRTITSTLGSSIWKNAIVTLTHAASAPPDGPSGSPLSYEVFVAQRSHVVQQSISQAIGDLRLMTPSLMNPVSLVENHPSCRKNRDGQKVLPNGQTWRPQLLLLCYSIKILSEATALSKPQDPVDHRRLFGFRVRSPPLPYLLSWLLQSREHPKLPTDQGGESVDSDIDIDDISNSDHEDNVEDEYDQLPPFKPLRKAQLAQLSRQQKKAYFDEYDYRVNLLQKKQWREELKRMREMKKKVKSVAGSELGYPGEEEDPENGAPATIPVPLPDMVLPPSFDGDNPAFRYRFLEPTSQLLTRPVLDTHGWDHDCGYDGVNVEQSLALASRFPIAVSVQVTKDKKDFNINLDSSISAKHGENRSTMAGFDIQNVGKQLAYFFRGETKFKNLKKNKMGLGGSVTFLGENVTAGMKLEDQITIGKRLVLVGSTGTVRSRDDSAYGANLEVRLRDADFPISQDQSTLGLSLVKWRGDLALGANLQSQISVGRNSKIAVRAGLNNKMNGQITVRTSSSDQLQIALAGLLPIFMAVYKNIRPGTSERYSMY